jgi:hypothetical protein
MNQYKTKLIKSDNYCDCKVRRAINLQGAIEKGKKDNSITSNLFCILAAPILFSPSVQRTYEKIDNRCEMQFVVFLIVKNLWNEKKERIA